MSARLRQNSVNDSKIQKVKFFMGIFSFNTSCVNNPSSACKVVETHFLKCKLTLVNSIPSICTHTRTNGDKNSVCLAKHFTKTKRILHRYACGACDKFHVCNTPPLDRLVWLLQCNFRHFKAFAFEYWFDKNISKNIIKLKQTSTHLDFLGP